MDVNNTQEQTLRNLRAEVKLLMVRGLIKPVPGLDDLSEETLESIIVEYKKSKLKSVNETICVTLVNGMSSMCKGSHIITDEGVDSLRDELLGNEGFMSCATNLVGKVTPCVPYVGIAVGFGILGKYLYDGVIKARNVTENHSEGKNVSMSNEI